MNMNVVLVEKDLKFFKKCQKNLYQNVLIAVKKYAGF